MAKPEQSQFLLGRLLVAILVGGVVWIVLYSGLIGVHGLDKLIANASVDPSASALASGDVKRATTLFNQAIQSSPADPQVYGAVALICMKYGKFDLAAGFLDRSLLPCKDAPSAERAALYVLLSNCLSKLEKTAPQNRTIYAAQRATELDPNSVEALNAYGYFLAENGLQLNDAVGVLARALQLQKKAPDSPETRLQTAEVEDSYGWALYKLGRYDAAISALNQAIADVPEDLPADPKDRGETLGELYYHLGAAARRDKRPDAARRALETAVAEAPGNQSARDELADLNSTSPPPRLPAPAGAPVPQPGRSTGPPRSSGAADPGTRTPVTASGSSAPQEAGAEPSARGTASPPRPVGKPVAEETGPAGTRSAR